MKKALIIVLNIIGAFFLGVLGALTYALTMWNRARKNFTPEEYELFEELIEKTF